MSKANEILLKAFNKGNEKAYADLFDMFYSGLCQFSERYVLNSDVAEDIVQEVFIKLFESNNKFTTIIALKVYLYRSVKNVSLNHLNSLSVANKSFNADIKDKASDKTFLNYMLEEEVINELYHAIEMLPDKRKEIVKLSMAGLSNTEISDNLSISVNTIKTQKKLAYSDLRAILKPSHCSVLLMFMSAFE